MEDDVSTMKNFETYATASQAKSKKSSMFMLMKKIEKSSFSWNIPSLQHLNQGASIYLGLHSNAYI